MAREDILERKNDILQWIAEKNGLMFENIKSYV